MTTITRTLEATFVPPTAHKRQKLRETLSTYRQALQEAFDAEADTLSAANEIVTPYDLTHHAKNAIKRYVPQLHSTYEVDDLSEDRPLRLTNTAATFDHDDTRTHEICWRVPQVGRGNGFWIPLRINPEQKSLWMDLLDGRVSAGELRLQYRRDTWALHATIEREVKHQEYDSDTPGVTYIGLDIGESSLITGCALQDGSPTDPIMCDGSETQRLRKEMFTTLRRLQSRDAADWRLNERTTYYQNALTDIVEKASRRTIEYAGSFVRPVLVLEDLSYLQDSIDYGPFMNRRLHGWMFARLQKRIVDKAQDAGVPVEWVAPAYTSQICHACGHIGSRTEQAEFRCLNDGCWVTSYQADINAAANIANRANPWGASCPLNPGADDSPWDGSGCDTAATQSE